MHFSHQVAIPISASSIDLADWLFGLSEKDYGSCARAHRAIGMLGGEQRLGMVNVESIGGSLLIQHYATHRADKDRVTMVSAASRAYLMHLVPVKVGVSWDMQVLPQSAGSSQFLCAIDIDMPLAVRLLGSTIGTPWFIKRHLVEETCGFARNIVRKVRDKGLQQVVAS